MDNDVTALPYDYVIGSVHRVDNEEVDRATDQRIYDRYETYDLYAAYYANSARPRSRDGSRSLATQTSSRSFAFPGQGHSADPGRDRGRRRRSGSLST